MANSNIKKLFFPLSIGLLLNAGACSDVNNEYVGETPDKTYTSSSGLEIYYNGVEMPGKSVSFSRNGVFASLTGFSTFDLSQLNSLGLSGELPCPGIIPGSAETTWNVSLTENDGFLVFSGEDSNNVCSYKYNGKINSNKLIINITDAVLSNHPLSANAWRPAPVDKNDEGGFSSMPIYVDWEIEPLPDIDINLSQLLQNLTVLPVIPVYNKTAYMSVSEALSEVLQAVSFRADGNILFTYVSTTGGAASLAQTQANGLQYSVNDDNTINLYINPLSLFGFILENTSGSTPPEDVNLTDTGLYPSGTTTSTGNSSLSSLLSSPTVKALSKALLEKILPQIATGIPLNYTLTDGKLDVFIDTPTSLSIIQTIIETLMENDEAVKEILATLDKNDTIAPLLSDLPKLQQQIQTILLHTTQLKIGFAFIPA